MSYFLRVDYLYAKKYSIGVSGRYDGISSFKKGNQWATFPAISLGWTISEEDMIKYNFPFINHLKLRGSIGQTGNQNIDKEAFFTKFSSSNNNRYSGLNSARRLDRIGNPDLTWEKTTTYDAGFDYAFFLNRINGSFAYFYRDISDMMLSVPVGLSTGASNANIYFNAGKMKNHGLNSISLLLTWITGQLNSPGQLKLILPK
ncbi:MAG: TonB-dependent receptor [Bacteroidales bacterium]|nr:TonB-dependent receptor [Bacteroidales bacterium]